MGSSSPGPRRQCGHLSLEPSLFVSTVEQHSRLTPGPTGTSDSTSVNASPFSRQIGPTACGFRMVYLDTAIQGSLLTPCFPAGKQRKPPERAHQDLIINTDDFTREG